MSRFVIDPQNRSFPPAEPLNEADIYGAYKKRGNQIRESWIRIAERKLLQDELKRCVFREQVNAHANCRHLAIAVTEKMKEAFITRPE